MLQIQALPPCVPAGSAVLAFAMTRGGRRDVTSVCRINYSLIKDAPGNTKQACILYPAVDTQDVAPFMHACVRSSPAGTPTMQKGSQPYSHPRLEVSCARPSGSRPAAVAAVPAPRDRLHCPGAPHRSCHHCASRIPPAGGHGALLPARLVAAPPPPRAKSTWTPSWTDCRQATRAGSALQGLLLISS